MIMGKQKPLNEIWQSIRVHERILVFGCNTCVAVCHEGGTGRLQSVRREWNPAYYRTVEKFGEATGVPVLLNTSFNLRGEPIVNTPENALSTFARSDIDALVMGQFLVHKAK